MSAALPIINRQPEFLDQLIQEQQDLTAVEQFSEWHAEANETDPESPAQEKYYRNLMPASAPGPNQQFAFEVDLNACSGCKACVVACHTMNGLEEEESWRRVGTLLIGDPSEPESALIQHVTTACHHCEDPGCLNGCPVKAYDKDPVTGIVRHLDDQCIGCKYCTMMCPYEVPQYSDRLGIVRKCDMCHQRLSVGEAPACVQSCPNEAIRISIVEKDSVAFEASDAVVPSAPASSITLPTTTYTSKSPLDPDTTRPQDEGVDPVAESHWPLAIMLVATQISVGILIAELVTAAILTAIGNDVPAVIPATAAFLAFAVGNAGLAIAPLHLGKPLRAWRVFLGLRTSWLSREAIVLGKFMGVLAGGLALTALPIFGDWIPGWIPSWAGRGFLIASVPIGLAGLYCSAMIYIATQRQLWRPARTFPRFLATTFACGPITVAAVFALSGFSKSAALLCLFGLIVASIKLFAESKFHGDTNESDDEYDRRSKRLISHHLFMTLRARIVTGWVAVAMAVLASLLCLAFPIAGGVAATLAAVALIAAENLERLLYFQGVVYDRMPGTL